jgi:hypothetical protein
MITDPRIRQNKYLRIHNTAKDAPVQQLELIKSDKQLLLTMSTCQNLNIINSDKIDLRSFQKGI